MTLIHTLHTRVVLVAENVKFHFNAYHFCGLCILLEIFGFKYVYVCVCVAADIEWSGHTNAKRK